MIVGNKGTNTRQKMIEATALALEENGYLATGVNDITKLAKSPKGSLYFHFPGGKDELTALALEHSGKEMSLVFSEILKNNKNPSKAAALIFQALEKRIVESNFKKGCPIAITALESTTHPGIVSETCLKIYNEWIKGFETYLMLYGASLKKANSIAVSLFSLWEGALLLAKLQKSAEPLRLAKKTADLLIKNEFNE